MWYPTKKADGFWRMFRNGQMRKIIEHYDQFVLTEQPDAIAMLATGRIDQHGTEMFAEDIITQGDNYPSVIKFGDNEWIEGVGFYLEETGPDDYYRCHSLDAYTNVPKILGNTCQNPELMSKE
jgi:hypothetical protein